MKSIFVSTVFLLCLSLFIQTPSAWSWNDGWDDRQWKEQQEFNRKMNDPYEFQKRKLEAEKQKKQYGITTQDPPLRQSPGAINSRTGEFYPGIVGGAINPRTGEFYPSTDY